MLGQWRHHLAGEQARPGLLGGRYLGGQCLVDPVPGIGEAVVLGRRRSCSWRSRSGGGRLRLGSLLQHLHLQPPTCSPPADSVVIFLLQDGVLIDSITRRWIARTPSTSGAGYPRATYQCVLEDRSTAPHPAAPVTTVHTCDSMAFITNVASCFRWPVERQHRRLGMLPDRGIGPAAATTVHRRSPSWRCPTTTSSERSRAVRPVGPDSSGVT